MLVVIKNYFYLYLISKKPFKGKIRDNLYSSVAVSTCDGIRGVVFDGDETFYLEQEKNKFGLYEHFLIE